MMKPFELVITIGENTHQALVTPEIKDSRLIYTCLINDAVIFSICKDNENRWQNLEGNASALSRLVGWEIDHHLKRTLLKKKMPVNRFDLYY